jgi:antitoxin (DNA-binding transcriptional repressor) of toxin-antitoxin stability system
MKTISIRQLHEKTGQWARLARRHGELVVTDRGEAIARITPEAVGPERPYFARRVLSPSFRKLASTGKLSRGTDSTLGICEDRN